MKLRIPPRQIQVGRGAPHPAAPTATNSRPGRRRWLRGIAGRLPGAPACGRARLKRCFHHHCPLPHCRHLCYRLPHCRLPHCRLSRLHCSHIQPLQGLQCQCLRRQRQTDRHQLCHHQLCRHQRSHRLCRHRVRLHFDHHRHLSSLHLPSYLHRRRRQGGHRGRPASRHLHHPCSRRSCHPCRLSCRRHRFPARRPATRCRRRSSASFLYLIRLRRRRSHRSHARRRRRSRRRRRCTVLRRAATQARNPSGLPRAPFAALLSSSSSCPCCTTGAEGEVRKRPPARFRLASRVLSLLGPAALLGCASLLCRTGTMHASRRSPWRRTRASAAIRRLRTSTVAVEAGVAPSEGLAAMAEAGMGAAWRRPRPREVPLDMMAATAAVAPCRRRGTRASRRRCATSSSSGAATRARAGAARPGSVRAWGLCRSCTV